MVLSTTPGSARRWLRLRFLALLLVTALIGHDLVFASQFGLGEGFRQAMTGGGHDGYWMAFSMVIVGLGTLALVREGLQGVRLARHVRGTPLSGAETEASGEPTGLAGYLAELRQLWPRLFLATAALFTIQENLEHVAAGQAPHGLGSLIGTEHPYAVPILAIVVGVAAAVGALIRWRIHLLEVRVARAAAHRPRLRGPVALRPERSWSGVAAIKRHAWFLVRLDAGRAPPVGA